MTNPETIRGCSNSESFREQAAELQAQIPMKTTRTHQLKAGLLTRC
jgi:hypothetical protein